MPLIGDSKARTITVNLPAGATGLSEVVNLSGLLLARIDMPATWQAANLTFQVANDGATFGNVHKDGIEYTVIAAQALRLMIPASDGVALQGSLKIRSGTSGSPVNQTTDRVLTLIAIEL